jgi:trimeric autotransporter adhesin
MRIARVAFGLFMLSLATLRSLVAQQYVISTVAGGGPPLMAASGDAGPIGSPLRLATDAAGSVYFTSFNSVFKLDRSGTLTRVAGTSKLGYSGDGGPAASARLQVVVGPSNVARPGGLAVDSAGNLFIADTGNHSIRRVSPSGIIATVAGNSSIGYSGDGGPATRAQLRDPTDVAVDGSGNLFIADTGNHRIRRVSTDGIITTLAGTGSYGFSGDDGPANNAQLCQPSGVAMDTAGDLFIADSCNSRIRKVSPTAIITTVAGGGLRNAFSGSGDGGPATSALLWYPAGVALDHRGNVFIADTGNHRIRKVTSNGTITTVAGTGTASGTASLSFSGDGGPATSAQLSVWPSSVAVDGEGNLFIADTGNRRIRRVSTAGIITTVAGDGTLGNSFSGDGGPATDARLHLGELYSGIHSSVTVDGEGNLFIADAGNNRIRRVAPSGIITTLAGNGTKGFSGDGGAATSAHLNGPQGVAVDGAGNLFIADTGNNRVRTVSPAGIVTTLAGDGTSGFSGDGGPATSAQLKEPSSLAMDGAGNLFIADTLNQRIRRVSPSGIITTMAGGGTLHGSSGDSGPATSAQLNHPTAVAVDSAGNLFIADSSAYRIRRVSPSGIITTVAGGGALPNASADGGPATDAALFFPTGMSIDRAGNLFIATSSLENGNNTERIRKVSTDGIITTVAGTGSYGFSGDGGPATDAELNAPSGLAVDGAGNVYIADGGNHVVRILRPANQSPVIGAVIDAASQRADPVSPGKIVVIYGVGLGPFELVQSQPVNGQFGAQIGGTAVSFNGIAAPILYASATQVAVVAPYALGGTTAQVTVAYQGRASAAFAVPVARSAPSLFTSNQTGAGQAAAINAVDGTVNTAAHPVAAGGYISLFATGEGQTSPPGVDGRLGDLTPTRPALPVSVTVGGIAATYQYAGSAQGQVAGLMQVNVKVPDGVQPGGYVPVVLQVGDASTTLDAVWIAVSR